MAIYPHTGLLYVIDRARSAEEALEMIEAVEAEQRVEHRHGATELSHGYYARYEMGYDVFSPAAEFVGWAEDLEGARAKAERHHRGSI